MNEKRIKTLRVLSIIAFIVSLFASLTFQEINIDSIATSILSFIVIVLIVILIILNAMLKDYKYLAAYCFVFAIWTAITFINFFF